MNEGDMLWRCSVVVNYRQGPAAHVERLPTAAQTKSRSGGYFLKYQIQLGEYVPSINGQSRCHIINYCEL